MVRARDRACGVGDAGEQPAEFHRGGQFTTLVEGVAHGGRFCLEDDKHACGMALWLASGKRHRRSCTSPGRRQPGRSRDGGILLCTTNTRRGLNAAQHRES
jgi:hypothetical protein